VGDHEHRLGVGLAAPELDELRLEAGPGEGVEGTERLVEQEDPRADGEGPGDRCPLGHAARHLVRSLVAMGPEADSGEVALGHLVAPRLRPVAPSGPHRLPDVGLDAQPGQERVALEHHGPIRSGPGHRLTVEEGHAGIGRHQAADDVEQRRLAAARVTDERHELPGLDGEVDAPQHVLAGEPLLDPSDLERHWCPFHI
jgi:hypothetical protein